jgi:hypothetical protein
LLTWTERILSLPVRTAAVAEFLRELSAKGWGDLNGVLATFNDGELSRDALGYWLERGWIVRAPSSALSALTGPAFSRELTLREFCGGAEEENREEGDEGEVGASLTSPPAAVDGAEEAVDENQ